MIRQLWPYLIGEPTPYVRRSATGEYNQALGGAWGSYYADRALLLITVPWLVLRYQEWTRIQLRPSAVYEQNFWLGELIFPTLPSTPVYLTLLAAALVLVIACFLKPSRISIRLLLASLLILVSIPPHGFGHIEHTGHLLLLGHVYSTFRPLGKPAEDSELKWHSFGYTWFLFGLLAVYTASGLWKVVDMTIRDVLKPGVTWLDPEGMVATSIASMRGVDVSMTIPRIVESVDWAFPIGYIILTIIFTGSFIAAFRRPFLFIILPTVVLFHLLNALVMYVLFIFTIFVALAVLWPYDLSLPGIKKKLVPAESTAFSGRGRNARFVVQYAGGDSDVFEGFYAYRERLRFRSALLASPLYYPGLAWICTGVFNLADRR